jgi:hypothetical protein
MQFCRNLPNFGTDLLSPYYRLKMKSKSRAETVTSSYHTGRPHIEENSNFQMALKAYDFSIFRALLVIEKWDLSSL